MSHGNYQKYMHRKSYRKQSIDLSFSEQCEEKGSITFEAKPDPELIIKSVLEHFPYLKFRSSFRGIDNYNFAFAQPWDSPHGNYGLHGGIEMKRNIVSPATVQAINSSSQL
jgi:hypothetical protein